MDTLVRRAKPDDAACIAELGRVTFRQTFGALFRDHQDDLRAYLHATFADAKIERSLDQARNVYWIVERAGMPAGYAKLKHPSPMPGQEGQAASQLQKIYVLAGSIGHGLGQALLEAVIVEAARLAPVLWLDVLEANSRAIAFYRRHGFAPAGNDTYGIGQQVFRFHLMTRRLT